jgi:rSAM/selenodomain-associated transferase 2
MNEWLGADIEYRAQSDGDIGERMERSFHDAFDRGACRVVLIGTDCPGIMPEIMDDAYKALSSETDLALGPATDGGYYLVGMCRHIPELFRDILWSTETVLQETRKVADRLDLTVHLVTMLDDVDRPEDLAVFDQICEREPAADTPPRISVIVPALNEAENIGPTLTAACSGTNIELIVVDGGSDDNTAAVARSLGAIVIDTQPGRAGQMNAGAAHATGDLLLFLHADTLLPDGFDKLVRDTLNQTGTAAGAFEFRMDATSPSLNLIQWLTNYRSRRWQMPYGDQGLFVRKELFDALGGFPDIPIMEDFEIVRRLRRHGRITTVPAPAVTSARRWLNRGIWRTTLLNNLIILAYRVGISPSRLARWYERARGVERNE